MRIFPYFGRSTESAKPAGRRDDDLREPRADREDDRVPEVAADLDVEPRLVQVAPGRTVREPAPSGVAIVSAVGVIADFASQSDRPEPDDHEREQQDDVRRSDAPPDAALAPVGGREQRAAARVVADPRAPARSERDHRVLHERVTRR